MHPSLTFHGAAECVTGSCAELHTAGGKVLIDCGMFQGPKTLKALNYGPLPFAADEVAAVLLTHAHIDHSGLLPKLMRAGFRGPIYATAATRDLCEVMLADAAGIQEGEVRRLNYRNERRGRSLIEPIYTRHDARKVMAQFETVKIGELKKVLPGLDALYWEAGHILGAASIELFLEAEDEVMRLLFSGDLGPGGSEFVTDPDGPSGIDHLIVESTYGNRERAPLDQPARRQLLVKEVLDAYEAGGPLIIPAFAVERTQELLSDLVELSDSGELPPTDIFLDSPLAIEATEVFRRRGWNKMSGRNPFEAVHPSARLRFTSDAMESGQLERLRGWHIIMAASGMCDAGRIRAHLKRNLWRREATVLMTGFQATGSLGRFLQDGEKVIRIQGDEIRVKARIRTLDVFSGHADAKGLEAWVRGRLPVSGSVFLTHGEPNAVQGLMRRLAAAGIEEAKLIAPQLDQCFELTAKRASPRAGTTRLDPDSPTTLDWHNLRTRLLTKMEAALETAATDQERENLILHMEAALGINGLGRTKLESHPRSSVAV